jgi:hypothetical protein
MTTIAAKTTITPRTNSPAITRKVLSAPRVAARRDLLPLCRLLLLLLGVQRSHMTSPEVDAARVGLSTLPDAHVSTNEE